MALFKIINKDKNGNNIYYKNESDIYNLLNYIYRNSFYTQMNGIANAGIENVVSQYLNCQRCHGREFTRRAIHAVISYDTETWEREMNKELVVRSVSAIQLCMSQIGLNNYQYIICAHDNGNTRHLHIVINPVNIYTGTLLNYYVNDLYIALKELAKYLYEYCRIALLPVSYIDEKGKLRFDKNGTCLYENINHSWDPHLKKI